jgi:diguanylate cyclase (GGDEF)-like protein
MTECVRVLLVDPNDQDASDYTQALASRGWAVHRARTFLQALELVEKSLYNVAIIEVMLPDIVGTEAWSHIRKLQPNMVAIMTTRSPSLHASINAFERGMLAYLLKSLEMNTVCDFVAQAVEYQRAAAEVRGIQECLAGLNALLSSIRQVSSAPEQIIDLALTHFHAMLKPDWAMVSLLSEDRSTWAQRFIRSHPSKQDEWTQAQAKFMDALMTKAVQSQRPVVIGGPVPSEPAQGSPSLQDVGLEAMVVIPLIVRNQAYGALALVNREDSERVFTATQIELIAIIGQSTALALDNAYLVKEVREAAILDKATGIYSSAYFGHLVAMENQRQIRYGRPFSRIQMDWVNSRRYSEVRGGQGASQVLCDMAGLSRKQLRSSDVVARYTDDGIAFILPETTYSQAQQVADRLARAIEGSFASDPAEVRPKVNATVVAGMDYGKGTSELDPGEVPLEHDAPAGAVLDTLRVLGRES